MARLTLWIDDEVLRVARLRAEERNTTVHDVVRAYLERLASEGGADEAIAGLLALAEHTRSGSGPGGRTWTRDSLYGHVTRP